jgi:hypothetical protein
MRRAKRALRVGYGHSAWFFEGHHGEGDEATLTIGGLTVGVKGQKVVVTIGKDGRDAPTGQHPSN